MTAERTQVSLAKRLLFSLAPALLLLLVAETGARWSGVAETCPLPTYLATTGLWECDPILHFRMGHTLQVNGQPLNALGMRGPLLDPAARRRMIVLGDSATFGIVVSERRPMIMRPYPERIQALAEQRAGHGALSVLNAGVCGYNSYHGIMLLRTKLRAAPADLILAQYGWNDLLTTAGFARTSAFQEPATALGRAGEDVLLRTALYPLAIRLRMEIDRYLDERVRPDATVRPTWQPPTTWTPNVPLAEYEHNLRRIVELARGRGAAVWLATSADAFTTDDYRGREDAYDTSASAQLALLGLGGIKSFRELDAIHRRYNDAVRQVGAETGVPVVDLEAVFRDHSAEHLFTNQDAIHPVEAGHGLEAEVLIQRLEAAGMVEPAPTH